MQSTASSTEWSEGGGAVPAQSTLSNSSADFTAQLSGGGGVEGTGLGGFCFSICLPRTLLLPPIRYRY